jgi:hypothetical protein
MKVTLKQVQAAIARANRDFPRDWQAEVCEVLLIPAVYAAWQKVNIRQRGIFPVLTRETDFKGRKGYWLRYGLPRYEWKRDTRGHLRKARRDPDAFLNWNHAPTGNESDPWYSHSPGNAMNGIGRETWCRFAEHLRYAACYSPHLGERGGRYSEALQDVIANKELSLDAELEAVFERACQWRDAEAAERQRSHREFMERFAA